MTALASAGAESALARSPLSESHDRPWQLTSYAVSAGLTYQRVFDIDFETNGNVWIAASDGLLRYDGYEWKHFGTNDGLPSSFVRSVLVSHNGELWVGSDQGAGVYNWQTKKYDPRGAENGLAGPNVRHMVQDPDGTIWFCCDQWPDTSIKKGGLTAYRKGKWISYRTAQGLPLDYVLNYFRDSTGRQFAMTSFGWVQWTGERWAKPQNPGFEADTRILMMAEGRDGTLFAQGETSLLVLSNKEWHAVTTTTAVVCSTRDKEVLAVSRDESHGLTSVMIWNGGRFATSSGSFPSPLDRRLYKICQAPDSSIWCVGSGFVERWDFGASNWRFYPNLPTPDRLDSLGRLWFHEKDEVVVREGKKMRRVPELSSLLSVDQHGGAWGVGGGAESNTLFYASPANGDHFGKTDCSLNHIQYVFSDSKGFVWVVGRTDKQQSAIQRFDGTNWLTITPGQLNGKSIRSAEADPVSGLWILTDGMNYDLAHVEGTNVDWESFSPARPPLTYPTVAIGAGRYWLVGYDGLFYRQQTGDKSWRRVDEFPDRGFQGRLMGKDEMFFIFGGGRGGQPGYAVFRDNAWTLTYGVFNRGSFGQDKSNIYIGAQGGVFMRTSQGRGDLERIPLPVEGFANSVVEDENRSLWIGTSEGVFLYSHDQRLPRTVIRAAVTQVQQNTSLAAVFGGTRRFSQPIPDDAFHYSWRFDDGLWTRFADWRGNLLSVQGLSTGKHVLQARARDAHGLVDPGAARLEFTVLPVPMQERLWFKPVVIALAAVLLALAWIARVKTRETLQHNKALQIEITERRRAEAELQKTQEELERRVEARTLELAQTNKSLSHEIIERTQAEETRKLLEEQLRQSQKIESIGTMAGGIAHDFNNILAVIIPNTHIAIDDAKDNPAVLESLQQVLVAADRAADLVRQILAFSRQQKQKKGVVDLQPLVKETLKLLRSALPANVEISTRFEKFVSPVFADMTQIHQVIMNLCANAGHAITTAHGIVQVVLEDVNLEKENSALVHPDLHVGKYVRLSVTDNGCGMSTDVLERIFDPFFTTKQPGKGTGLGLAVVHGIVKDHGGAILVFSELKMGSRFDIYLPAYAGEVPLAAPVQEVFSRGNGERILLVDDESAICNIVKILLTRNGYRVSAFTNPINALEAFTDSPKHFDLLFTDLSMPSMTGLELASRMQKLSPELPVIIMTGFGGAWAPDATQLSGIVRVVEKPIAPSVILETLQSVLLEKARKG